MKLALVNPPSGIRDPLDLAPPLGLLTLAAVARQWGHSVQIFDFNLEVFSGTISGDIGFYDQALIKLLACDAGVFGFTSMCLESHVSLELAKRIKAELPGAVTILGGTHFGAIPREILSRFQFIDFVVSGEGEAALLDILESLESGNLPLSSNVFFRRDGEVWAGVGGFNFWNLEEVPFPAYDLVELDSYFALNPRRVLNYEAGRGCIFNCSFCYSPAHYGGRVRNKSHQKVILELKNLSTLGAQHVFFVQDNLLNSRDWALDLCERMSEAVSRLSWSCYLTHPQLGDEMIEALAQAGCAGVFIGIDAVSKEAQNQFDKRFFRQWSVVAEKLRKLVYQGVTPTCAFILSPEDSVYSFDETLRAAVECKTIGCDVHLNALSLYQSTPLWAMAGQEFGQFVYSPAKPLLLLDAPPVVCSNQFAIEAPFLFPYHATSSNPRLWNAFVVRLYTLFSVLYALPCTLSRALVERSLSASDLVAYLDEAALEKLCTLTLEERRRAAILEFVDALGRRGSFKGDLHLRRELARLLLSVPEEDTGRVQVSLGDATSDALVSRHLDLSTLWECREDALSGGGMKEFALLLGDEVRFMLVAEPLAKVLHGLRESSGLDVPMDLSEQEFARLESEGWITSQGLLTKFQAGELLEV